MSRNKTKNFPRRLTARTGSPSQFVLQIKNYKGLYGKGTGLLSYFEKNSSLVGLNFGLCIYVSMYVCFFLCIGLCHTNQIEATILPWKVIHQ